LTIAGRYIKEIEKLKVQKAKKLQIATSMTERNKLMQEINQLNAVQRSPNALKEFLNKTK